MSLEIPAPRCLADGVYWLGDCVILEHEGETIHAYHSAYLVGGEESSLLVDTGHPKDWRVIAAQLDGLHEAGMPEVRHVFPTHAEVPHAANLGRLLAKYPGAVACGDIRDYHLFFLETESRLVPLGVGDRIDLGGRQVELIDAVIKDLVTSIWAYDSTGRVLFPGDGFAYMHHHCAGECWRVAEELPDLPIPKFTALFNAFALYWTRFTDIEPYIEALEALLQDRSIDVIAPGHGAPILDPVATLPRVAEGLRIGSEAVLAPKKPTAAS